MRTVLAIPDLHIPFERPEALKFCKGVYKNWGCDTVVFLGDVLDQYCFSRYTKNPDAHGALVEFEKAKKALEKWYKAFPVAHLVLGNHDCYSKNTSVLTKGGWVLFSDVTKDMELAQFDSAGISFSRPSALIKKKFTGNLVKITSDFNSQEVTPSHDVVLSDLSKIKAVDFGDSDSIFTGTSINKPIIEQNPLVTKLLTWVICDGCMVKGIGNKRRIQFKLSRQDKIDKLESLLNSLKIPYTKQVCKKTGVNKPQPFYIRIYGEHARNIFRLLGDKKEFGQWVFELDTDNLIALEEALLDTDANLHDGATSLVSVDLISLTNLQIAFIKLGYSPSLRSIGFKSGFVNGKEQYNLRLRKCKHHFKTKIESIEYDDFVYCATMPKGTLVTSVNGRLGFSGNCRVYKRAMETAIPKWFMKDLRQVLDIPDTWEVEREFEIDNVLYRHGEGLTANARQAISKVGQSVVYGHCHKSCVAFAANQRERLFAMAAGCLVDDDAYAFEYAQYSLERSFLGCGVVIKGVQPVFVPLPLRNKGVIL